VRPALVEEDRVDALDPGGVLAAQVVIQLQQRPAFQDVSGRDPAFREPVLGRQLAQVPGVGLVGLGVPLTAAGEGGIGRLGQVHADPGRGQLLGHVPPPGAPLRRERHVVTAGEPRQPGAQVLPVGRGDLPARHLPGHRIEIVEGQLLPVDIQPAYDRHRDLLKLPRAPAGRPYANCYALMVTRLSCGGPHHPGSGHAPARPPTVASPMHVI
jgi:hypothetical protein